MGFNSATSKISLHASCIYVWFGVSNLTDRCDQLNDLSHNLENMHDFQAHISSQTYIDSRTRHQAPRWRSTAEPNVILVFIVFYLVQHTFCRKAATKPEKKIHRVLVSQTLNVARLVALLWQIGVGHTIWRSEQLPSGRHTIERTNVFINLLWIIPDVIMPVVSTEWSCILLCCIRKYAS